MIPRLAAVLASFIISIASAAPLGIGNAPATPSEPGPSGQAPENVVLAENAYTKLTLADYQTELLGLPPDMRDAFASDPKRVAALLNNLLAMKSLAAQARKAV